MRSLVAFVLVPLVTMLAPPSAFAKSLKACETAITACVSEVKKSGQRFVVRNNLPPIRRPSIA